MGIKVKALTLLGSLGVDCAELVSLDSGHSMQGGAPCPPLLNLKREQPGVPGHHGAQNEVGGEQGSAVCLSPGSHSVLVQFSKPPPRWDSTISSSVLSLPQS